MQRRQFLSASLVATAATAAGSMTRRAAADDAQAKPSGRFKLKYAPHFGMFRNSAGNDLVDQLKFAADEGFTAWEDNGMMGKPVEEQAKLGEAMQRLGIEMGVFVSFSGSGEEFVTDTSKKYQAMLRERMGEAVECARRVRATWTTVVPGDIAKRLQRDFQMANCIENLRVMAEVCEPTGLVMVLEPLNWWSNHPGKFLTEVPQGYLICRGVASSSCKVLDDLYHQQITEGNLIPNLDRAWEEIGYIQVGDNPGRKEPTTGEINYKNVFRHLHAKGYEGIIGMEHGNSRPGVEGERAVIDAYVAVDGFEA